MEVIHLVLGKANPHRMNGVNKVVYQMAVKQAAMGVSVSVWGITSDLTVNFELRNFETRLFPKGRHPFAMSSALRQAICATPENVVFHLHGGWIPVFYSVAKLLHQLQIPFVLTPHGAYNTIAMQRSLWMKKVYLRWFENKVLTYATAIHCLGTSEVEGLKNIVPNARAVQLPYGFENTTLVNKATKTSATCIFGFVGRLDIYTKGLDLLLDAFSQVMSQMPEAVIWIVGGGESKKLDQLIQHYRLQDKVVCFGPKYGKEKDQLMESFSVFLHPSRNEGLPNAVLEAAALGKPCIVTTATNMGSYIEHFNAGYCVENQNPQALGKALNAVYKVWKQPNAYFEMSSNACQMVDESFQWEAIIDDFNKQLYGFS